MVKVTRGSTIKKFVSYVVLLRRRATSVGVSLEKSAEALDGSSQPPEDRRTARLRRRWSTERKPPPKPPHTYYNKHRYPDEEEEPRTSGENSL